MKENFKREALLWVNLEEHPFILAARFVEEFSGRLFVAMDYIAPDDRGRVSLADHLAAARGPLDTDQALQWAIMFCYGMEHANQRGIKCHRDIKPANILIRQDGTLLISDFGLAAAAEAAWKGQGRLGGERRRGRLRRLEPIPDGGQTGLRHTGVPCAGGLPRGRGRRAE